MNLPATSLWPTNTWYVAATADEVSGKPLGRQICGQQIVLFRNDAGEVAALDDFCPHRGAALSLGFVRGDTLVCGYHGLAVGCTGKVACMPGQRVGGFPQVRSFPVIERHGFIWLWPGDASQASPELLPRLEWADSPEWRYAGGLFHVQCDYRLLVDNLMDLTHETYVHRTSIGQKEIDETPCKTEMVGDEVVTTRLMGNVPAPPLWQSLMRQHGLPDDQLVDRWQICHFSLPSHVILEVGMALAGHGGYNADSSVKVSSIVVDFITPETETSNWYFWGFARSFCLDDDELTTSIRDRQATIFGEDVEVLEQQQRNVVRYPDRKLLKLNIDAGGVRSRMLIDRAIAEENKPPVNA
ncbi:vanillate O-demethylase monooxygenase subunit [Paraburkholderia sp. BL23I1N1]|uniref:aromatic ring-hydroxylating oxygenase subunit alpha n=1 Tax=Paraburkholderia sp. BL23I1N1 TaxID=1938802 RepID=UPI000E7133B4|nr:aromatic ring-hydroxylating dioxygenase subunit alpha [Paraburkholderia sp. BL23I1N1]RKE38675.1 vanillate O-demethylase monooxygenase subunit [Paraburkholderia sp. BL23I1N1]